MQVFAVDQPETPPLEMPKRFRTEVAYFMTPSGEHGAPALEAGEYWVRLEDARRWLDDFVIELVSPLDAESKAEVELSEEHERFLEWVVRHQASRIRLGD